MIIFISLFCIVMIIKFDIITNKFLESTDETRATTTLKIKTFNMNERKKLGIQNDKIVQPPALPSDLHL